MSFLIRDDIISGVRCLIVQITGHQPGTEQFTNIERQILNTLRKSDSMYFSNTKDIDRAISSMADKFRFHGFHKHADRLKAAQNKYINSSLSESDLNPRLNVVKFLLCMSESPTNYFWQHPEEFQFITEAPEEELIDWGAYLNEGIERWSPSRDESFDLSYSDDEISTFCVNDKVDSSVLTPNIITENVDLEEYDIKKASFDLSKSIQNKNFYNTANFIPKSDLFDANVAILWEKYLEKETKGLLELQPITIITEYQVMREIIWQMFGMHSSTIFSLNRDKLMIKSDVTISSIRAATFEQFLRDFIPFIEVLEEFRGFIDNKQHPKTYCGYKQGVKEIIAPVVGALVEIEAEISKQETTMTLLILLQTIQDIFKPVFILKSIHNRVVSNLSERSHLEAVLVLLTRLRKSLEVSLNKLEQDVRLTLYLHSLCYYFTIINEWLVKNDFADINNEFMIVNNNNRNINNKISDNWTMNFALQKNISEFCEDGIIKIISEDVLQIGRNLHFLRLLNKYDIIPSDSETIHEKFTRLCLEEICKYFNSEISLKSDDNLEEIDIKYESDSLCDFYLTKAFQGGEGALCDYNKIDEKATLFELIKNATLDVFPLQNLPEKTLGEILKQRFHISGLLVKNILIENYNLDKQIEFCAHIFLFSDDLIFPFYRRLFEKMNQASSNWGNRIWLTGHLQDILMDIYPNFYEGCAVDVKNHWKECRDSLEACSLISVEYIMKWPLNIIITEAHMTLYKEVFQFILMLKWALYTANRLFYTDLESKDRTKSALYSSHYKTIVKRLKYLRFCLINILNSVQHYIFGFVFNKWRLEFELEFEKASNLKSLIDAHENYIRSIYKSVAELRQNESGFNTVLRCVKMLKVMWNKREHATIENLDKCHKKYKVSFAAINSIVNPVHIFDY